MKTKEISLRETKRISQIKIIKQLEKTAWTFVKTIVGTVPTPFLILDPKLRVIVANQYFYQTFHTTSQKVENQLIYDLGDKQWNIPKLKELLEKILPEKSYFKNFRVEHIFPKIGHKIMLLNGRQIYEKVDAPQAIFTPMILLIIEDITEQEELKNKIIVAEKLAALGKLSGLLVHELRNSLSAIRNSTYSLKMHKFEDKHVQRTLWILDKEGSKMDKIINDILGFAFGFAKKKKPPKIRININKTIKESLVEIAVPKNIKVNLKLKKNQSILAEEIHLKQLFVNIIRNAIEAMPKGGLLTITTKQKENCLVTDIQDTGNGIKKNELTKIFEPMFSTKNHGTGLGLTVCQRILKLYDGKIKVQSTFGKGAKFIIVLPIK